MAYELKAGEKLPRAIRRITKRQVKRVLCELTQPVRKGTGEAERVHEARKNLKKARAALRLVRDELGARFYRRGARHLRKVARALSSHRDLEVQLETVEKLHGQYRGRLMRSALVKLRRTLTARHKKVSGASGGKAGKLEEELCATQRDIKRWPVNKLKWREMARGISRTFARSSKAFHNATRTPSPENLHEWRKRAKDLWYQLRILKPIQRDAINELADCLKRLGQYLGDDHDLFMIEEAAKEARLECGEFETLSRTVAFRRAKLQQKAFALGRRLYEEKPSAFAFRIERYGKAARRAWNDGARRLQKS
jgi:CHAD domain-containing protein